MVDYKIKIKWQQKNPFISKLLLFMLFITAIESELGHVLDMERVSKKKKNSKSTWNCVICPILGNLPYHPVAIHLHFLSPKVLQHPLATPAGDASLRPKCKSEISGLQSQQVPLKHLSSKSECLKSSSSSKFLKQLGLNWTWHIKWKSFWFLPLGIPMLSFIFMCGISLPT